MSGTKTTHANVDGSMIKSSQKEILLGVNLDSDLKFEDHVNFMCKKASQKLYALARIAPFMDLKQRRNIMKAFVESQFGYCPLIWMFHSRGLHNKINCIYTWKGLVQKKRNKSVWTLIFGLMVVHKRKIK